MKKDDLFNAPSNTDIKHVEGKTIKLFFFGKKFNSHAKIFLLFTPLTWPPRTDSVKKHQVII